MIWIRRLVPRSALMRGISYMLVHCMLFTMASILTKYNPYSIHPVVFFWMVRVMECLWLGLAPMVSPVVIRPPRAWRTTALFGLISTLSMGTWFVALQDTPAIEATAVTYSTPLFVTLGAILWFRERPNWKHGCYLMLGFVGVYSMFRHSFSGEVTMGLWMALMVAVLWAGLNLLMKYQNAYDNAPTQAFYGNLVSVLLLCPVVYMVWEETPSLAAWGVTAGIGLVYLLNLMTVYKAYGHAPMHIVAPLDFLRLPLTALAAMWLWDEPLLPYTMLGAGCIMVATCAMTLQPYLEQRRKMRVHDAGATLTALPEACAVGRAQTL